MKLERLYWIDGTLAFTTAFHLGSGGEGEGAVDAGVLRDAEGLPLLPGSSLKGVFRATAESFAAHLGMQACFLDRSNERCASGSEKLAKECLKKLEKPITPAEVVTLVRGNVCDVCMLFGSPLARGRIRFHDASLMKWAGHTENRDGVGIDRDAGTAVPQIKYDFEVVPRGAEFSFRVELENPTDRELALVTVVLREWERGARIGGKTTRGLGNAELRELGVQTIDLRDKAQRRAYLLSGARTTVSRENFEAVLHRELEASDAQATTL
jgi:CRISPR-associated protein Csm3